MLSSPFVASQQTQLCLTLGWALNLISYVFVVFGANTKASAVMRNNIALDFTGIPISNGLSQSIRLCLLLRLNT